MTPDPHQFWASLVGDPRVRWGVAPESPALAIGGLVYLATPYTRRAQRQDGGWSITRSSEASRDALEVLRILHGQGVTGLTPVMTAHMILGDHFTRGAISTAEVGRMALDHAAWMRWSQPMLDACRCIYVPVIPGWAESAGIRAEVEIMRSRNRPVFIGAPAFEVAR